MTGSTRRWGKTSRCALIDNMIVGSGIDLVEIHRIRETVDRHGQRFLNKVYTAAEQAYCLRKRNAAESLAARFAAKEAGAKALGTGMSRGVTWLEIEIVREPGGRPSLSFHGRAAEMASRLNARRTALSITHGRDLAIASVLIED
jgi:holo-[acyl-carrier protein] synthase